MEGYKREVLNSDITLYTPNHQQKTNELIVLCTWLSATHKPISKYLSMYQTLSPQTPILHLKASVFTITPPYQIQRYRMSSAVTVLQRTLDSSSAANPPKIQIHTFSNGGSNSATQMLIAFHDKTKEKVPLHSFVCDSGPAAGEYWKSYHSIVKSMPSGPLFSWVIGPLAAHWIISGMHLGAAMGRYPIFEDLIRDTIIDEQLLDGKKTIAYFWSKSDDHVDWNDVLSHAEVAKKKGWETRSEEFVGSGHVGHWRIDPERYEAVVREMWLN